MKFGIDRLIAEPALRAPLKGRRVALLAHPASVTQELTHTLDALVACGDVKISAAFGPQHGLRGDKQDNMIELPDYNDPVHGIPVFSLYGEVRKPTDAMMDAFDVMLVDLQDLGCRIYTFITTLRYVLEAASRHRKSRLGAGPAQSRRAPRRRSELRNGWESFVGAGPLPMRHGLTLGELGLWFVKTLKLDVEYRVIEMKDWRPDAAPGFGWPLGARAWINPKSQRAEFMDGARLRGHSHARGHDALGRARHHATARIVRCSRYRRAGGHEGNEISRSAVARGLSPARVLV